MDGGEGNRGRTTFSVEREELGDLRILVRGRHEKGGVSPRPIKRKIRVVLIRPLAHSVNEGGKLVRRRNAPDGQLGSLRQEKTRKFLFLKRSS